MIIILFGLSGSGKSLAGKLLAERADYYFWDADEALPQDMRAAILNKESFTQTMRDDFTQQIIKRIAELSEKYPKLVVAQALYKEKNRAEIKSKFPEALFISMQTSPELLMQRIITRNSTTNIDYAKQISANFETPILPHQTLQNDGTENDLMTKLEDLLTNVKKWS